MKLDVPPLVYALLLHTHEGRAGKSVTVGLLVFLELLVGVTPKTKKGLELVSEAPG